MAGEGFNIFGSKSKKDDDVDLNDIKELLERIAENTGGTNEKSGISGIASMAKDISRVASASESSAASTSSGFSSLASGFGGYASAIIAGIQIASSLIGGIANTLESINSTFTPAINAAIDNLSKYTGTINARLYGVNQALDKIGTQTQDYYENISNDLVQSFKENSFIEQESLLENINRLVGEGIGYNYEERALLETIKDSTVSTFSALDATLNQLIRVQQADVSVGQFGAESQVMYLLNSMFSDSSYLNNMYDTVYTAIYEANTLRTYDESVVWSLGVQEWLGALYSVGFSSDTITKIASGLNSLATGDIATLSSNTSLQTLLQMGAEKAGLSYEDFFQNGLDNSNTNQLIQGIVELLQDVADNTNSTITKSVWSDILGVSIADLTAVNNLSDSQIATIASTVASNSYASTIQEAENQYNLLQSDTRTSLSARIQNTLDNMMYSVGTTLANNETALSEYLRWTTIDELADSLPFDFFDLISNTMKASAQTTISQLITTAINTTMSDNETQSPITIATNFLNQDFDAIGESEETLGVLRSAISDYLVGTGWTGNIVEVLELNESELDNYLSQQGVSRGLLGLNLDKFTTLSDLYNFFMGAIDAYGVDPSIVRTWFSSSVRSTSDMQLDDDLSIFDYLVDYYDIILGDNNVWNGTGLFPFMWTQKISGGQVNYSSGVEKITTAATGTTSTGLSQSIGISGEAVSEAEALSSFKTAATALEETATTVTNAEANATEPAYDSEDLYTALFMDDTKYVRVKIVDIEDSIAENKLGLNEVRLILDNIESGIKLEQSDVYSIIQGVKER